MSTLKLCGILIAVALLISCGDDPNARKRFFRYPVERCTKTNFTKSVHKVSCKLKYGDKQSLGESYIFFDCTHGCGGRRCYTFFRKSTSVHQKMACKCESSEDRRLNFDESDFTTKEEYQKYVHVCFPYEPLP